MDLKELARELREWFITRNEPNVDWGCHGGPQLCPQLRGLWRMGSVDEVGWAYDVSGQGRRLTNNNGVAYNVQGLCPYADFNGTTQYLSRPNEAGIQIGTAAYPSKLIACGWFYFDRVAPANAEVCLAKWNAVGNLRSWRLFRRSNANGRLARFEVSTDGINITAFVQSAAALTDDTWYFLAARYTPSTEIQLWVNEVTANNVAAIPATLFNSTAAFTIGADGQPSGYLDGRAALCVLTAPISEPDANLDAIVGNYYQWSRGMFNV